QALADVRDMLKALPPGGAFDLAGKWHELNEFEVRVARLEADVRFLEGKAAAELQRLDHLRAELEQLQRLDDLRAKLARVTQEAVRATALAETSGDAERAHRADDAIARALSIFLGIAEVEGRATRET